MFIGSIFKINWNQMKRNNKNKFSPKCFPNAKKMEFEIKKIVNTENKTTSIEVIFEDGIVRRTEIQNWESDEDTRGIIARTVFNIVKEEIERNLSKTIKEKGYIIKHAGRPKCNNGKSEEQRASARRSSLHITIEKKAKKNQYRRNRNVGWELSI